MNAYEALSGGEFEARHPMWDAGHVWHMIDGAIYDEHDCPIDMEKWGDLAKDDQWIRVPN